MTSRVFGFVHFSITEEMKPSDIFFYRYKVSGCILDATWYRIPVVQHEARQARRTVRKYRRMIQAVRVLLLQVIASRGDSEGGHYTIP